MLLICNTGKKYQIVFRVLAYDINNPIIVDTNYCVDVILRKLYLCWVLFSTGSCAQDFHECKQLNSIALSLSENPTVASLSFLCWHWRYLIKIFSFVSESVRDVIGRKIKISVKKKVKLETKGDKVDNKILVSTIEWLWLHMWRKSQYLFRRHKFSSGSIL